jgi:HAD superfamily hydrolase (TIGR01509 family)
MIKGIFFDVGGTLYSYKNMQPTMKALLEKLAEKLELEQDIGELTRQYQLANKEVDKLFAVKSSYLFHDYFKAIFDNFLSRLDKPHLNIHFDWFAAKQGEMLIGCMELQPDCHETLARLKDMGLYLSAVSNADENQLKPLVERGQLHQWLTHWTSSEAAQSCKPDRKFFEIALKKSGLSADQVMFVGDSLEQDILGAHAMGMTTVLITEADLPTPMHIGRETPDPHFSITRLSELPEIIENFRGRAAGI